MNERPVSTRYSPQVTIPEEHWRTCPEGPSPRSTKEKATLPPENMVSNLKVMAIRELISCGRVFSRRDVVSKSRKVFGLCFTLWLFSMKPAANVVERQFSVGLSFSVYLASRSADFCPRLYLCSEHSLKIEVLSPSQVMGQQAGFPVWNFQIFQVQDFTPVIQLNWTCGGTWLP